MRGSLGWSVLTSAGSGYGNLIADIGVLIAFYYGATGLTCGWSYRKVMLSNTRFFFVGVLLPFLSGIFCFWVGYEVIKQSDAAASASVLVAMALGVPLVFVARYATHSDFFRRGTIAYDSIEPSPGSATVGLRGSHPRSLPAITASGSSGERSWLRSAGHARARYERTAFRLSPAAAAPPQPSSGLRRRCPAAQAHQPPPTWPPAPLTRTMRRLRLPLWPGTATAMGISLSIDGLPALAA